MKVQCESCRKLGASALGEDLATELYSYTPNGIQMLNSAKFEITKHPTSLSVRFVTRGACDYYADNSHFRLNPSNFLILNQGQTYAAVNSSTGTEVFTIGFASGFAGKVLRSLVSPEERLLDEGQELPDQPVHFFEKTYLHDRLVSPVIRQMVRIFHERKLTGISLEEHYHILLERLLAVHRDAVREAARIPAAKHSTRLELYRRLGLGREFIHANPERPVSLREIASAAGIAPHHFLRSFKKVFGVTPHQYLLRLRLESARVLLEQGEEDMLGIALSCGFTDLSSFSRAFKKSCGIAPTGFRKKKSNF